MLIIGKIKDMIYSNKCLSKVYKFIKRNTIISIRVRIAQKHYRQIEERIRIKSQNSCPINVCFLVTVLSKWKDEELYKMMEMSPLFSPIIIATPYSTDIYKLTKIEEQERIKNFCKTNNYNYRDSFDTLSGKYIPLSYFEPDIVFLCEPYEDWIDESYRICGRRHINYLPCHTPYAYWTSKVITPSLSEYHSTTWRQYYCSEDHRSIIKKQAIIGDKNLRIVGYQTIDKLLDNSSSEEFIWKNKDDIRKKVIIAPHYSISTTTSHNWTSDYGSFLLYAEDLIKMVDKYKEQVVFAFKPHPGLYIRLVEVWGKQKTDDYYHFWETQENTLLSKGEYINLFKSSDAMIHDSGSFVVEYLSTGKPLMHLSNKEDFIKNNFDDFGIACVNLHYKGYSIKDIENFIENIVIKEEDYLYKERISFINKHLQKINGKTAAENIIEDIKESLL